MNWTEALSSALQGNALRRLSHMRVTETDSIGGMEVRETGPEGFRVFAAWSVEDNPVMVFVGAYSRDPFIPSDEDKAATDWVIE